jgi:hypothetical protein
MEVVTVTLKLNEVAVAAGLEPEVKNVRGVNG